MPQARTQRHSEFSAEKLNQMLLKFIDLIVNIDTIFLLLRMRTFAPNKASDSKRNLLSNNNKSFCSPKINTAK